MVSEAAIIAMLAQESGGFIGDDAAVLPAGEDNYVITKDMLIEDVHFRTRYVSANDLAHKALMVNLSDLAAMGAAPKYILCGIAIPKIHADYAEQFLKSLLACCRKAGVILIGGDTNGSSDHLAISITAIGTAAPCHIKYRHGAAPGDVICVVGPLGYASLGFLGCEQQVPVPEVFINSFLRPEAKVLEGLWLGKRDCVTSMMDLSDGLALDLGKLCKASGVAGIVELERLNLDASFAATCALFGEDPCAVALAGGEDYSLMLTVTSAAIDGLAHDFLASFGNPLQRVGYVASGSGVSFMRNGKATPLPVKPFTHFGEHDFLP